MNTEKIMNFQVSDKLLCEFRKLIENDSTEKLIDLLKEMPNNNDSKEKTTLLKAILIELECRLNTK